jgi:hypothetical protein
VEDDVLIDSETLLLTDFMNFKIKSAQSFRDDHRSRMCVHVFIEVYVNTYVYTVFLTKYQSFYQKQDGNVLSTGSPPCRSVYVVDCELRKCLS